MLETRFIWYFQHLCMVRSLFFYSFYPLWADHSVKVFVGFFSLLFWFIFFFFSTSSMCVCVHLFKTIQFLLVLSIAICFHCCWCLFSWLLLDYANEWTTTDDSMCVYLLVFNVNFMHVYLFLLRFFFVHSAFCTVFFFHCAT